MPKKILIFSLAYYPSNVSGAEAAIKEITDRIKDIEFHLITLRFDKNALSREKIGNVFVYRVGVGSLYLSKILFIPLSALKARILHKEIKFSAIWAMMTYMLIPTVLTKFIGVKIPHILTLQDGDPYEKVFGRIRILPILPIIDYGFRSARIIQTISTFLSAWPRKRGYMGEVQIVYNGANPKDIADSISSEEVEKFKKQLGKKEGEIYLVNTARLEHQKAQDVVIKSLKFLPENIKFLIVGGGSDEGMLKNLVKELGLESRIIFTGNVERSVVTMYRKVSDIFVAPSRSEGLGNAFLSAMASRLPVIATQEGGLSEFIFDEKRNPDKSMTAWVVDKDNPEQIANAVKEILTNREMVKKVTENSRAMVLEKYDWDKIALQMRQKVFGKVI